MATLHYIACKCIKRGDAFRPGTVGHLYVVTNGKRYSVRKCARCGR